jgi:hypothetical protein
MLFLRVSHKFVRQRLPGKSWETDSGYRLPEDQDWPEQVMGQFIVVPGQGLLRLHASAEASRSSSAGGLLTLRRNR